MIAGVKILSIKCEIRIQSIMRIENQSIQANIL